MIHLRRYGSSSHKAESMTGVSHVLQPASTGAVTGRASAAFCPGVLASVDGGGLGVGATLVGGARRRRRGAGRGAVTDNGHDDRDASEEGHARSAEGQSPWGAE